MAVGISCRMQLTFPDTGAMRLEARSTDGGIARSYSIRAETDLFGWTIIDRRWGRIGCKGRSKREAFEQREAADKHIRELLRRRSSAHARIGVPYRPVSDHDSKGFS